MKDLILANVTEAFYGQPWAITPEKFQELAAVLARRKSGVLVADDGGDPEETRRQRAERRAAEIGARVREVAGVYVEQVGKVAVLPLSGTITRRPSLFSRYSGGTSAEQFAAAHAELMGDSSVKAVVWDVDSPGGSVAGVPEAAAKLLALRGEKKTVAVSNTLNASAAYWLSSAADEIVSAPSGLTGSIGVLVTHEDWSKKNAADGVAVRYIHAGKYKVEGNPDEPLTDEGAAALQQMVDDFYAQFVAAVAKGRNTTVAKVRNGFGEGRVLTADRAVEAGLVDRVGTLDQTLRRLGAYDGRSAATARRQMQLATANTL